MKAATVHELKKELGTLNHANLLKICLRLAKFKKDNKELITYMLFEAGDEEQYIEGVKNEMQEIMESMNRHSTFYMKKTMRKTIRQMDKFIRYSGLKETEAEIRISFCEIVRELKVPIHRSKVMTNMFNRQLKKINTALSKLHEDLQYDYQGRLEEL